ncbi:MAG: DUF364 domain-containing protein [Candidatus Marinimicrobia bacterium]|nr:DUF364 domain-containing protein [Candidatus Neomarinimicrobiota bacterium]
MESLIANRIIETLADCANNRLVSDVRLGLKYIAVQLDDGTCGVAYRFRKDVQCDDISLPDKGLLAGRNAGELLSWLSAESSLQRSIGLAVANSLASSDQQKYSKKWKRLDGDILSVIEIMSGERVAMIGYFKPIAEKIRERCSLEIYENDTSKARDLIESAFAANGLNRCDIALITSTSIINGTIDHLLDSAINCREVVMLGPSTPLIPEVFHETPVTLLSGVVVTDSNIMRVVSEGGGTRQFMPYVQKRNYRLNE